MRYVLELSTRILAGLAALVIVVVTLLTTADAFGRYLFNSPISGAYQMTEDYLMVVLVFFGLATTYASGTNVRVTILADRLKGWTKVAANYFAQILSLVGSAALTLTAALQIRNTYVRGLRASGVHDYLLWPAYLIVFIGLLVLTLYLAYDLKHVADGTSCLIKESDSHGEGME